MAAMCNVETVPAAAETGEPRLALKSHRLYRTFSRPASILSGVGVGVVESVKWLMRDAGLGVVEDEAVAAIPLSVVVVENEDRLFCNPRPGCRRRRRPDGHKP